MIIQTVYKPEENIDFLEEWLDHHCSIGVTHFYMYDNSRGIEQRMLSYQALDSLKKKNKHGLEFTTSPEEADQRQRELFKKFPVTRIKWQRTNALNQVVYDQEGSMRHFAKHIKSGLCAFIDVDEFLIKKEEFKQSRLQQHKYKSRNFYKSVYDCHERVPLQYTMGWNPKAIIDMSIFPDNFQDIHFRNINLPETLNFFNHYNHNEISHTAYDSDAAPGMCLFSEMPYENIFEYVEDTQLIKKV